MNVFLYIGLAACVALAAPHAHAGTDVNETISQWWVLSNDRTNCDYVTTSNVNANAAPGRFFRYRSTCIHQITHYQPSVKRETRIPLNSWCNCFLTDVTINGIVANGMIDTGATDVALTAGTASRLGLHPAPRDYNVRHYTANGIAYLARVTLDHVQIGTIEFDDVRAFVGKPGALATNLIGTSLLQQLHVDANRGMMTLSQ